MQNNIKELFYRIKDNIKSIENDQMEKGIFDEIENDFYQLIDLIKLFLISERDIYYGYFMMNLSYNADFHSRCIAGIRLNTYPPVMDSNPLLLCKFSLKEIIFIICHEIEHIILCHPAEMAKLAPAEYDKFNYAADASVNDRLRYEIINEKRNFMKPSDSFIFSETLEKIFNLSYVEPLENYCYYYQLIKDKNTPDGNNNNIDLSAESDNNGDDIITSENCGKYDDHNWQSGNDPDEVTAVIREFINASTEMMDDDIKGLMPVHFLEQRQYRTIAKTVKK